MLECATGVSNSEVSRRLSASLPTVRKWRSRFLEQRLDGLVDEPRPGRPALISVDRVEQVVIDTLESTPKNATHWSRAKMAEKSGLSKSTVGWIWKAFGQRAGTREGPPRLGEGMERKPQPFIWTKTAEDILASIARYLRRINGSGHQVPMNSCWIGVLDRARGKMSIVTPIIPSSRC